MASNPPAETIGKYRVLARIGRGGMGTVLKAHDPILDRVVALKVISADVDVTDELRARFFREAQAGARLSHPNIVTVYDLAEAEGRRVIVMEFLDGHELRQIITERRPLGLDEKLGILIQLCDGLAYAHRHGVVHRDIKPGNIFVLQNGNTKILDFGVARIVAADAGLTRTGLIMGTLRYIAPEQARGRADHRSDIFSAGAVCYELLAYRAAFPGDDPMEILEAIRSHEPPLLNEFDPSIPPELAAVVARAMHKDPERRVQDLDEMSEELQSIRRGLLATLDGARQRLRRRLDDVARLQAAVSEQLGGAVDEETVPIPHEGGLATLAALEQNAEERLARLGAILAAGTRLSSTFERGLQSLEAGQLEEAVAALERVVHEIPEHGRARAALDAARARIESRDRRAREQATERAQQSRRALERERAAAQAADAPALAVEAWQAAGDRAAGGEAAALRRDHAAAAELFDAACALYRQAASDAVQRRRQHDETAAHTAARDAAQARQTAAGCDAERYAPAPWRVATEKETLATDAVGRGDFAAASVAFADARREYERAADVARGERLRQERDAASRARAETERAREAAQLADAASHAGEVWSRAEQARVDAEALLARGANTEAAPRFGEAASLYAAAAEQARRAVQLRRQRTAESARARVEQRRKRAEDAGAAHEAGELWRAAEEAVAAGRAAFEQGEFLEAAAAFERASETFGDAEAVAREATLSRAALAEEAEAAARRTRVAPHAPVDADATTSPLTRKPDAASPPVIVTASARPVSARRRAVAVGAIAVAVVAVGVAGSWYWGRERRPQAAATRPESTVGRSESTVGRSESTVVTAPSPARESVAELRRRVADARKTAEAVGAPRLVPTAFGTAVEAESLGTAALSAGDAAKAEQHFTRALTEFAAAGKSAGDKQQAEIAALRAQVADARQAAEKAGTTGSGAALAVPQDDGEAKLGEVRTRASAARDSATKSGAAAVAEDAFESANRRWSNAQSEAAARNVVGATRSFGDTERLYRDAERVARRRQALRADAEAGRDRAKTAGADFLAKDLFDAGSARLAEGNRLASARDWVGAERAYTDAVALWADAQRRLKDMDAVRAEAEKTKERREQARQAGAETMAKEYFDAAAARHVEADRLARSANITAAIPVYQDAARGYADAEKRVRDSRKN